MIKPLLKYLQRRLYSFLNSWWGFSLFLALIYLAVVRPLTNVLSSPCSLRGGSSLFCSKINFSDNIASQNLESALAYGPIDVVYTWVNGSDPVWLKKKELWTKKALEASAPQESPAPDFNSTIFGNHTLENNALNATSSNSTAEEEEGRDDSNRYRNSNELKYSLRSLIKNAPWIHHIYLVTDNQIPSWLNMETNKLSVVSHDQIFSNLSHLPVFSSPAIETHLHRIPNLSKKFIYFNDDVFLGAPVYPEDFVSLQGVQKLTMSWDVPKCAPGCSDTWIGDGYCDKACNVSSCNFDFPDCVNGSTGNAINAAGNKESRAVIHCTKGCPDNWLGDKICDARCKHPECAWDVGDCGIDLVLGQYPGGVLTLQNSVTTINEKSVDFYAHYQSIAVSHPHLLLDSSPVVSESISESDSSLSASNDSSSDVTQTAPPTPLPSAAPTGPSYYHNYTKMLHVINHHAVLFPPHPPSVDSDSSSTVAAAGNDSTVISADYTNGTFPLVHEQRPRDPLHDPTHFMHDDVMGVGSYLDRGHPGHYGYDDTYSSMFNRVEEPVYGPPVVASVPVGTKAVYIDISMLPCLFQINSTCNPTQLDSFVPKAVEDIRGTNPYNKYNHHNNFQFNHAEHSDLDNSIVQSVTLLQKHSLLVVLLYSSQEEKPQPPPLPLNITLTVTGTQTTTGDTVSASFSIEITPTVANDVQYANLLPAGMHIINESYATAVATAHTSATAEDEAEVPTLLSLSTARVLKIPFSTNSGNSSTIRDGEGDTEVIESDHEEQSEGVEGVVVEVILPSHSHKLKTRDLSLRYTVTMTDELQHSSSLSLCSAVVHLTSSGASHLPRFTSHYSEADVCPYEMTQLLHESRSTHLKHYYIEYTNLDPHSKLLVPPRDTPSHMEAAAAASGGFVDELGRLYLMVPLPKAQKAVKHQWIHWRVDLVRDTDRSSVHSSASVNQLEWSVVNMNHTVSVAVNGSQHHSEVDSNVTESRPDVLSSSRLGTIVGMVRWGSGKEVIVAVPDEPEQTAVNSSAEVETVAGNISDHSSNGLDGNNTSRRRLGEDTYAQSLINVNRLYNKNFGNEARKVPAHLPHMIDRDIMTEMQTRYSEEWNATSTHRFRSSKDMQYSFSYYYYLIHRHKANPPDLRAFIAQFVDTNRNGVVDFNELRTLVAMMKGRTPQPGEIQHIHNCIVDTARNASIAAAAAAAELTKLSLNQTSNSTLESNTVIDIPTAEVNSTEPVVDATIATETISLSIMEQLKAYFKVHRYPTVDEVFACEDVRVQLKEKIEWDKRLPTHTILSDKDTVAFEMIGDNYTDTLAQLDSVRARQSKFICINDNMQRPSAELEEALQDFYIAYFPQASIFELPVGSTNPTLYTDEYHRLRNSWWYSISRAVSGVLQVLFRGSGSSSSVSEGGASGSASLIARISLFAGVVALALFVGIRTATRFGGARSGAASGRRKEHADSDLAHRAKLSEHNEGRFLHRHSQGEDYTVDDCEVEKRHAEVFSLGDMSSFDLDEDDLNDLDDEELAEKVRRQKRSWSSAEKGGYDPTRNEWNENDLTAVETISSLANTGEEYLNALLRNVGWSEEQGGAATEGGEEASRDQIEDEEEDSQDEEDRERESFTLRNAHVDKPLKVSEVHRTLSSDNQYVSMIPTNYSSGTSSGYYNGGSGSDSSRNNSLSGERTPPTPSVPHAAAAPTHHKISFFSGSKKKAATPAAAPPPPAAAKRAAVPPPLPATEQQLHLVPLPPPSMRPTKSCLQRSDRPQTERSVRFSSTIMMGDSAEPVAYTTNSPPRGGRKIMYRGQRVVEFVQGGMNLMRGLLANPEGGSLYDR